MCLKVKQNTEFKVAKRDIKVFKCGYICSNKFLSGYMRYSYEYEEINELRCGLTKIDNSYVTHGFHSYINMKGVNWYLRRYHHFYTSSEESKVICTIPKGANYIEGVDDNGNNCIVSDQIVIHKPKRKAKCVS